MPKVTQLNVPVENRPGTLAKVARVLGDAKVNIYAFATGIDGARGYVQVLVTNVDGAKRALTKAGMTCTAEPALFAELPDKPGSLASYAGKLAAKNINVTLGYGTTAKGGKKAGVVLAVSDVNKAARIRP